MVALGVQVPLLLRDVKVMTKSCNIYVMKAAQNLLKTQMNLQLTLTTKKVMVKTQMNL
eukprot:CAMPEP_0178954792 /NCGR_PEP_ID=MMETSP0789-20121207/9207_1 /TAXON_ID=3005 /ORGANISM="Rhizosolenia setigera, Strain CCMP 1694" /LENGTH=57 /DNA_ID=CAMNT_0020636273 /DNA_START=202 /DNA_END=378 /DNA_ORIENTATION=+